MGGEFFVWEHKQVRNTLKDYDESILSNRLYKLSELRNITNYKPFTDLTDKDLNQAIKLIKYIFNNISH